MTYKQFLEEIKSWLLKKTDQKVTIEINHVIKNNGLELDGLAILENKKNISPNIYINAYYDQYQSGKSIEEIGNEILNTYMEYKRGEKLIQWEENICKIRDFSTWKDKIIFRVVNYEKNKKLLELIPHIRFLDLAITFHCLVKQKEEGIESIRVTNELIVYWEIKTVQLVRVAMENTQRLFPVNFRSMTDVLQGVLQKDIKDTLNSKAELIQRNIPMYILSNKSNLNGAAALLYPNMIQTIAVSWSCDLFILPSSIHEVILVPYQSNICKEDLLHMVVEVNQSQVPEDEILSNNIYVYHKESKSFDY